MKDLRKNTPSPPRANSDVDAFLRQVAATPSSRKAGKRGRLLFAMDATASRGPTWDHACQLQGQMFEETASLGGLDVQLAWYRGFREFRASPWVHQATDLLAQMSGVRCLGGHTQIGRVLDHAIAETRRETVNALVFVGDAMEEEVDDLCHRAGQLGLLGVPAFVFQEGRDPVAETAFRQIAQLTRGAWCAFDHNSAQQLRELLRAVAVFAAGGRRALADHSKRSGGLALRLTHQIGN